jgi:universal stress protein E
MAISDRILVVVDPTRDDEQACVTRGAWLAEKFGRGIDLLICHYEQSLSGNHFFDSPGLERARKDSLDHLRTKLEKIAGPLQRRGLDVIVSAAWDTPLDEGIIRHVLRTHPFVVVKETHYHSALGRTLFTNTDWNLVRLCPEPLWLAKDQEWLDNMPVLASVDPTHDQDEYANLDDQILNPAAMLADRLSCDLHAFHALPPIVSGTLVSLDPGIFTIDDYSDEVKADHKERLEKLLDGYPVLEQNVHLKTGYAAQLLPEVADDIGAGVVVMGSIKRTPLQRVLVGSTTEQVLDKLPCDLLVVKPEWFECPVQAGNPKNFEGSIENQIFPMDADSEESAAAH